MPVPRVPASPIQDVERVLVVVAHPDDADFGAAGTIAGWVDAGIDVSYCLCTSGDAGGFGDTPRAGMAALREAEQRSAAAELGVHDLIFLGYPDGQLIADTSLRCAITREIRRVRPQRVLTQSPEIWWRRVGVSHPDHRATGEAALAAVFPDARNPFAHPALLAEEGLAAWSVPEMWLMGAPDERINHAVDVTDRFDRKVAALRAHASQTTAMSDLPGFLRGRLGEVGELIGLGTGVLAESFQVVSI